jgi:STE24 endopeptidase
MELFLITIFVIYTVFKLFIEVKEAFFIKNEFLKGPVLMDLDTFKDAALYAIHKHTISIISSLLSLFIVIVWFNGGMFFLNYTFNEGSYVDWLIALGVFFGINYLIMLPLDIYQKMVDKKFGFNKSGWKLYIIDQIKVILLTSIFGGIVMFGLLYFINNFENWWILGFVFVFLVVILINVTLPFFMMMFNKFEPIEDGELKSSIEDVMNRAEFKIDGLFSMNASKRDSRLNAFFAGLGNSKRVVLYDTLIDKLSVKEIVAVLGHELGHFKHKDILKNISLVGGMLFVLFFSFAHIPNELFSSLHIENNPLNILIITILFMEVVMFVMQPIMNLVSRHNEFEADKMGAKLGDKEDLKSALIKLVSENKSFPKYSKLYSLIYNSHPPVLERIKELDK